MDPKQRRRVLRLISNGMYVVTGRNGSDHVGATITWLTQSSFEPPLLVCGVRPDSSLHAGLDPGSNAIVHMLADDQKEIAQKFFTLAEVDESTTPTTINGLAFEATPAGALLADAGAWAVCEVRERIDCGGDHSLVVLEVVDVGERDEELAPLTVRTSPWEYGG